MGTAVVADSRYDPRCDTVAALDARLVALARSGAPIRRALARIAGEFVTRRAWEPLGFVRPADYARERPGLSAREIHDLVHVNAALAKLPAIDHALTTGQLGWTKARLVCRVATPESEAHWLALAGQLSAAALSREVRAIDVDALESGGAEQEEGVAGEREVLRVRVPRRVKAKWGVVKRTLRRVAGEWLPNETCAELVAAEVLSAIGCEVDDAEAAPLAQRGRTAVADCEHVPELPTPPAAPAARSVFVEALLTGLEDADARELDQRLCRAAALERGRLARIGPLLLALERACVLAPVIGDAWREGRLTGSQLHTLVTLVLAPGSEPVHAAWIERAAEVTVRRLEDDVEHALATGALDPALIPELTAAGQCDGEPLDDPLAFPAGVQIGAEHTSGEETDVWAANVPGEVARLFRACLCSIARRLNTSRGRALEVMFDHALRRPSPSAACTGA